MIVFVSTAYLAILAVYSYHFCMAFLKNNKSFNKVQAAFTSSFRSRIQRSCTYNMLNNSSNFSDTIENSSNQVILARSIENNNYREPLLSDNELTAITESPNIGQNSRSGVTTSDFPVPPGDFGELSLQVNTQ